MPNPFAAENVADPIWREAQRAKLLRLYAKPVPLAPVAKTPATSPVPPVYYEGGNDEPTIPTQTKTVSLPARKGWTKEAVLARWDELRAQEPQTPRHRHYARLAKECGWSTWAVLQLAIKERPCEKPLRPANDRYRYRRVQALQAYNELCETQPNIDARVHASQIRREYDIPRATWSWWMTCIEDGAWSKDGVAVEEAC